MTPSLFPDEGFAVFWDAYPRHEAKKDAMKAWEKLGPSPALQATILDAIAAQKCGRKWREGFVCLPATFLRGERWLDDIESAPTPFTSPLSYGCDWCEHHPRCETPEHHTIKARAEARRVGEAGA
jgi:hypothetical protein